jgi:nicotinamidase-related amidase
MTSALLIIDVQQGLCEGPQAAFDSAAVITRINAVSARARTAGLPVIFIQHESGPGYLEYGSRAWQLAQGLHAAPGDLRIRKTTPDAFLRTRLQETLESLAVRDLIICGMHSEFCVDTTTRRALGLGYPVRLMEDGHTTVGNAHLAPQQVIAHHNTTLSGMSSFGPRARPVPGAQLP